MLEMFLPLIAKDSTYSGGSDFFTFVDMPVNIQPTITRAAGVVFEDPPTIGEATLGGTLGIVESARSYIDLGPYSNMLGFNWTIEFTFKMLSTSGSYCGVINLSADDAYPAIQVRFGGTGFGNRLQVSTGAQQNDVFSTPYTKAQLTNVVKNMALVGTRAGIAVFVDGVRQRLAVSTGTTYSADYAVPRNTLNLVNRIGIANAASMNSGNMLMGPIVLTGSAKYA